LVVTGEFNAGKSALINALPGQKNMAEGATLPATRVTLIKWVEKATEQLVDENYSIFTYPCRS
jgi:GTP-binding protein EngB required for normal cell division